MLMDLKAIFEHVCDCIESEYQGTCDDDEIRKIKGTDLEKGLILIRRAYLDSLTKYDSSKMDFHKFVNFNRSTLIFETDSEKQSKLLKSWGKFGGETDYYLAIYPFFKVLYEINNGGWQL